MSQINHISLDTGELTSSAQDEFTENAINEMIAWLMDALESQGFVPLPGALCDYNALIDKGDDGLVCSIYGPAKLIPEDVLYNRTGGVVPDEGVPLLIFGVALKDGQSLWKFFLQGFYLGDRVIEMPAEPWITVIPYQMYPYIPDPDQIIRFQNGVARAWLEAQKKLH
ncbi:hypothetical protein LJC19_04020 [Oxalobacter sp. OttesenSCG-928-P03]|nr:hypothetical protein [Oxalobacter sp. OttesenSCG-928-P03]